MYICVGIWWICMCTYRRQQRNVLWVTALWRLPLLRGLFVNEHYKRMGNQYIENTDTRRVMGYQIRREEEKPKHRETKNITNKHVMENQQIKNTRWRIVSIREWMPASLGRQFQSPFCGVHIFVWVWWGSACVCVCLVRVSYVRCADSWWKASVHSCVGMDHESIDTHES